MTKDIKLPEIADNIDNAIVLSIHVSKGDIIKQNDTIAEMESDKAAFDLPSDVEGKVKEIKVNVGDEVKVGQVVITIETETDNDQEQQEENNPEKEETPLKENKDSGKPEKEEDDAMVENEEEEDEEGDEDDQDDQNQKNTENKRHKTSNKTASKDDSEEIAKEEEKEEGEKEEEQQTQKAGNSQEKTEVAAAPSIRRIARELGIDIYKVEGTGPGQRITADDVKSYSKMIAQKSNEPSSVKEEEASSDLNKNDNIERQPLSNVRQKIASNVEKSWQTIPHVFQFDKADITDLDTFINHYNGKLEDGGNKLTITAILIKIMAQALKRFPYFNASLDSENNEILLKKYFNIGVAVDSDRGLLIPVLKDVDTKSILEISEELSELAERTRNKKVSPDELQGSNIVISNLGGIGGTYFTPIIYSTNVAIMGVSKAQIEPSYLDGEFKPRQILPLSISYDHRVIDGAQGARFLRWFCEALENPLLTIL